MTAQDAISYDSEKQQLTCRGDWDLAHLTQLEAALNAVSWPSSGEIIFNGQAIQRMDSAGAWLISKWQKKLEQKNIKVDLQQFPHECETLLAIVADKIQKEKAIPEIKSPGWLATVGQYTASQLYEAQLYLSFIGELAMETLRIIVTPHKWRWAPLANVVYRSGYQALPIIGLLSFLIGVVLTYQMGLQLRNYGANIYIVDLLGLAVLREFGPLIMAIMVAGRTGSAFTAQLGMMKLNQEIDALDTMGVTPAELLLLPRIIGLFIAMPLLTMWADVFGVFGGMVMANNMLGITWYDFLHRFPSVIPLKNLLIGLGKAPVFALIIGSVGCFQGMEVKGSADSVGRNTTRSVVLSIFFIIVVDAIFSVIFSKLKL